MTRICPGRWLSGASLFITIASVVHTFNINPILDANGKTFDPHNHEIEGTVTYVMSIFYVLLSLTTLLPPFSQEHREYPMYSDTSLPQGRSLDS